MGCPTWTPHFLNYNFKSCITDARLIKQFKVIDKHQALCRTCEVVTKA